MKNKDRVKLIAMWAVAMTIAWAFYLSSILAFVDTNYFPYLISTFSSAITFVISSSKNKNEIQTLTNKIKGRENRKTEPNLITTD